MDENERFAENERKVVTRNECLKFLIDDRVQFEAEMTAE